MDATDSVRETVDAVYTADSRRVLATLIRLLGDFDAAEEALHDAFRAALEQWPRDGVPANPRAWLVSAGRFKAIDAMRRRKRFDALDDHGEHADIGVARSGGVGGRGERRRRPAAPDLHMLPSGAGSRRAGRTHAARSVRPDDRGDRARVSTPAPTLAQRIVRAKTKIRQARIPYRVPDPAELPERLDAVLRVIYLVFNEGYAASSGGSLTRHDLSDEAIRLGRLLVELLPRTGSDGTAGPDAAARLAARAPARPPTAS